MNCRPGDLAVLIEDLWLESPISNERVTFCKSGAIVRCVFLEPDNCWRLEEPRAFQIKFQGPIAIHVVGLLTAIRDDALRPIRDPGEDAIDETLIYAGDPRVRELVHG